MLQESLVTTLTLVADPEANRLGLIIELCSRIALAKQTQFYNIVNSRTLRELNGAASPRTPYECVDSGIRRFLSENHSINVFVVRSRYRERCDEVEATSNLRYAFRLEEVAQFLLEGLGSPTAQN